MTTAFRGLASLRHTIKPSHSLHSSPHAFIITRAFTVQTSRHEENNGLPDFKNIKFPRFPLGIAPKSKSSVERRITRVQEVETNDALPHNFEPITSIPPRPGPGLTPWITDEDARQYLTVLFSRQWSISRYRSTDMKPGVYYQLLSKLFVLRKEKDASAFSMGITQIVNNMVHHPTIHKLRGKEIIFRTLTHDAYVTPEEDGSPIVVPGVTMHDVRLAMRIEKLWDKFWKSGRARLPRAGWKFTGRKKLALRYWGMREARLVPTWREDLARTRIWLRAKWLKSQGRSPMRRKPYLQRPKNKTPTWKKMLWKNMARRRRKELAEASESEAV